MTTTPRQAPLLPDALSQQADGDPVTCLGQTFPNDAARRAWFTERLAEKLKDAAFRATPGFPKAVDDAAILRLSDPPYYTACPNPWLTDLANAWSTPYDPDHDSYRREPFAVDVSEGKTDAYYKLHGYHTKVPHLAIVPSILHYTKPGDLVLDGFAGSGMTGVAAQWCGRAPVEYRRTLEATWKAQSRPAPEWGARRAILNDLSPAATFIAAGYTLPFDVTAFAGQARRILDEVEQELGWMYETRHTDGRLGRIEYTVWSEVFSCPACGGEIVFVDAALDPVTKRVRDTIACPSCGKDGLDKDALERRFETLVDPATGEPWQRIALRPVLIVYRLGKKEIHQKQPAEEDLAVLARIARLPLPPSVPTNAFPLDAMYHGSRLGPKGFRRIHHLFLPRAAQALGTIWAKTEAVDDPSTRRALLFLFEQAIWGMSVLNRYKTIMHGRTESSNVNQYLSGVYYVPSQHSEVSPWYNLDNRLERMAKNFGASPRQNISGAISVGSCAAMPLPDASIDYVFTDPPFGENIYYADLNFLVESWHGLTTDAEPEAIVDRAKKKDLFDYQRLMEACFAEYHRVLKPGRWMTVVFHNSSNAVWNAIQEALMVAGFMVADVRTLDKQQVSYRQTTSMTVKQDLVISAYKPPTQTMERFTTTAGTPEGVWELVREHLRNLPVVVAATDDAGQNGIETNAERMPNILYDRMIAFHLREGVTIPLSLAELTAGLGERFPERDGMYFLPEQVAVYDRERLRAGHVVEQALFVTDEASAIQWLRRELTKKPRTLQDLTPEFMRETGASWSRDERVLELRDLLEDSFLEYDGTGDVPSQIHSYLSSNYREYRNLEKDDVRLRVMARDRWYVPDPNKAVDLERVRDRALLREFEHYRASTTGSIKRPRLEAIRAGFKQAWGAAEYGIIISVAKKLPRRIVEEDPKLLLWYDTALTRSGIEP